MPTRLKVKSRGRARLSRLTQTVTILPVCALMLAFLLAAALPKPGFAQQGNRDRAAASYTTKARHALLMEADTGAVLFEHKADEPMPPASMSKLMTVAMAFKAVAAGQLKMTDQFVMSVNAWRKGGAPSGTSAMMVPVNTKATLDELLQGIIVQSGNDSAIAVAEGMAGSETAFAGLMNEEAKRIGMTRSTFENATGLPSPGHLTTARDLAILARHLMTTFPDEYPRFAQKEFNYRKHRFLNRNPLVFQDTGTDGLKTGHTREAGYGLVASAKQGTRRLILVIGGLPTAKDRKEEAEKLLDWGFRNFTDLKIFENGEIVGQARVWGGQKMYVPLTGQGEVTVVLPRFPANQRIRAEIVYEGPLKPPIRQGDAVAKLRVISSTGATNEVKLVAAEDVSPGPLWRRGLDSLVHLPFRFVPKLPELAK